MSDEKTKIELDPEDAELFKKFREYQDVFKLLVDNGVFEAKKAIVTISINNEKTITDIDVNLNLYRRRLTDSLEGGTMKEINTPPQLTRQ